MKSLFLFIAILSIFSVAPGQIRDGIADTARAKYTIDNCVNEFTTSKIESTQAGFQYWFADKDFIDGRTIKLSVVKPHSATHPPHSHPEDEFFFLLEGKAEFFLNGKTRIAALIRLYTALHTPPMGSGISGTPY